MFRDREWTASAAPGTRRILVVGDSTVFGWATRAEERFGALVEATMPSGSAERYDVLNAGVPGWIMLDAEAFMAEQGIGYGRQTIVLTFTVVNDVVTGDPPRSSRVLSFLRDHTYFGPFVAIELRFLAAGHRGPESIALLAPPLSADAYFRE